MKLYVCEVYGAMGDEHSGAAYPTKVLCEDCLKDYGGKDRPESRVVSTQDWDESWPNQCEDCGCDPNDTVEL